jgi:hypothetical protein
MLSRGYYGLTAEELIDDPMTWTRAEAVREYRRHGLGEGELVAELGDHDSYQSDDVLIALGY